MTIVKSIKVHGPLSVIGLVFALTAFGLDQAHKWWMLGPFDIVNRQPVNVTGFFDLVMVWNYGVSYGWFANHSNIGRWLLIFMTFCICTGLVLWLARCNRVFMAAALGLVIGGALANGMDRIIYGAVADFFLLHAFGYQWYVFNIADMAIVGGICGLVYDAFTGDNGS